jgi:pimeloyl-ACP methyl ester carboxylesterase
VPINEALLERYRRFEDRDKRITEEFLQPTLGPAGTIAVLSRPIGPGLPVGLVMCPSFGTEQTNLSRGEVVAARMLAAAGFSVIRYNGIGYGDSRAGTEDFRLSSCLAQAVDAARLLAEIGGVERLGMIGSKFGGMVAALAADREGLPLLVLWEPVVSGRQYMREFLRSQLMHQVVADERADSQVNGPSMEAEAGRAPRDIRGELEAGGTSNIRGFVLSREAYEEISRADLVQDLRAFRGASLVVSVTARDRVTPTVAKLAARLRELGSDCEDRLLQDPAGGQFGQRNALILGGVKMIDLQGAVATTLAQVTTRWLQERTGGPPAGSGSDRTLGGGAP